MVRTTTDRIEHMFAIPERFLEKVPGVGRVGTAQTFVVAVLAAASQFPVGLAGFLSLIHI